MNSEIICPNCHCLFTSPIILSCCSSSLCANCFSNISYKSDTNHKKFFNCPFCKKNSEESEFSMKNRFLEDFITQILNKEIKSEFECERCEKLTKYENIIICNECRNNSLCDDCSNEIHKIGKFKFHERISFTKGIGHQTSVIKNLTMCDIHSKEKLEYFCPKDSNFICEICFSLHKQSCRVSPVTVKFLRSIFSVYD